MLLLMPKHELVKNKWPTVAGYRRFYFGINSMSLIFINRFDLRFRRLADLLAHNNCRMCGSEEFLYYCLCFACQHKTGILTAEDDIDHTLWNNFKYPIAIRQLAAICSRSKNAIGMLVDVHSKSLPSLVFQILCASENYRTSDVFRQWLKKIPWTQVLIQVWCAVANAHTL